ncbi:MAG: hypothetical protein AB7H86_20315 [Blastocatellales bacterium]|mgnify:CR=1 FL=1
MKRMIKGLMVVTLVVAGLVGIAAAQEATRTRVMKIDFDFHVGKQLLSAGEYEFITVSNSGQHKLIRVREVNSDKQVIVATIPTRNDQKLDSGSVTFNKYGDQYFLSALQLGDPGYVQTVVKTSNERDIAKQFTVRRINTQPSGQ